MLLRCDMPRYLEVGKHAYFGGKINRIMQKPDFCPISTIFTNMANKKFGVPYMFLELFGGLSMQMRARHRTPSCWKNCVASNLGRAFLRFRAHRITRHIAKFEKLDAKMQLSEF